MSEHDKRFLFATILALTIASYFFGFFIGIYLTSHGKIKRIANDGRAYICEIKEKS